MIATITSAPHVADDPLAFLCIRPDVPAIRWTYSTDAEEKRFPNSADWIVDAAPGSTITLDGEPLALDLLPLPRTVWGPAITLHGTFTVATLNTTPRYEFFYACMAKTVPGLRLGAWVVSDGILQVWDKR